MEMLLNNVKVRNVITSLSILFVLSGLKNPMISVIIHTAQIMNNQNNHTVTSKYSLAT